MKYARNAGFTLVELLITVTIASIVVAMAVPSFHETVRGHQVRSTANDFYSLIRYARAEAMRRGSVVEVAPLENDDWATGAIARTADGTELRRISSSGTLIIQEQNGLNAIVFNGKGYLQTPVNLIVRREQADRPARLISILQSGFAWNSEVEGS